jgi:hypothetical protein
MEKQRGSTESMIMREMEDFKMKEGSPWDIPE